MKNLEDGYKSRGERCSYFLSDEQGMKTAFLKASFPAGYPKPDGKVKLLKGKYELLTIKIVEEGNGFSILQYAKREDSHSSREALKEIQEQMLEYLKSCVIQ